MITVVVGKIINKIDVKKHLKLPNIIFIEEIERGYHYTEYNKTWKSLIKTKLNYLVTTQSLEMIKALVKVSDETGFNDFELKRLYKNKLGYGIVNYSPKELKRYLKNEWEVR